MSHHPSTIENLPVEILYTIVDALAPSSLLPFALASRTCHRVCKTPLELSTSVNGEWLMVEELLVLILEDPRRARWLGERIGGPHNLVRRFHGRPRNTGLFYRGPFRSRFPYSESSEDQSSREGSVDEESSEESFEEGSSHENFRAKKRRCTKLPLTRLIAASILEQYGDIENETNPDVDNRRARHELAKSKLHILMQTSNLIRDNLRAALLDALTDCPSHPYLLGLLLLLCPQVEELAIEHGRGSSKMLQFWDLADHEFNDGLWRVSLSTIGALQEDVIHLSEVIAFLTLPGLERLEMEHVYGPGEDDDDDDDDEGAGAEQRGASYLATISRDCRVSALRSLDMKFCEISPEGLDLFLSHLVKPFIPEGESDFYGGLEELTYLHSIYSMDSNEVDIGFSITELASVIRRQVGESLQVIDLTYCRSIWSRYDGRYTWTFTREDNLRDGFPRLRHVTLQPESLLCSWSPHLEIVGEDFLGKLIDHVASLPLACVLPPMLQTLWIRDFDLAIYPYAVPLVLTRLTLHIEHDFDTTPSLRAIKLGRGPLSGEATRLSHLTDDRFGPDLLRVVEQRLALLRDACAARKIKLRCNVGYHSLWS